MRAAVVVEPGRVELVDVPDPVPDPYQVRVQTLAGGLCGTDRHIVAGTFYRRDYPAILGHESIGRVVELGERVRNLTLGDMVLRTAGRATRRAPWWTSPRHSGGSLSGPSRPTSPPSPRMGSRPRSSRTIACRRSFAASSTRSMPEPSSSSRRP